jgi:hypothetical protein
MHLDQIPNMVLNMKIKDYQDENNWLGKMLHKRKGIYGKEVWRERGRQRCLDDTQKQKVKQTEGTK